MKRLWLVVAVWTLWYAPYRGAENLALTRYETRKECEAQRDYYRTFAVQLSSEAVARTGAAIWCSDREDARP